MKIFSKSDKIKAFIVPKMIDLITFLVNNIKSAVYTGGNINGLYFDLEMIGSPTTLTTSGQRSHHFGYSYSIKNDKEYIHPVITALRTRKKNIC